MTPSSAMLNDVPGLTVLKLGGELIDLPADRARTADAVAALSRATGIGGDHHASTNGRKPALIVVHGGGRSIDAELARRGIALEKRDGIRITNEATLDAVVSVLAGEANTMLVAALGARGVKAVGLTGADAGLGLSERLARMQTVAGGRIDPGLVGNPVGAADTNLLRHLCAAGYVPVIASIGMTAEGSLLNVNADVMAAHVATALRAARLLVAGGTPGVLDSAGHRIDALDATALQTMLDDGTATAGMIAKLRACLTARNAGVVDVRVVDGRSDRFEQGTALR